MLFVDFHVSSGKVIYFPHASLHLGVYCQCVQDNNIVG